MSLARMGSPTRFDTVSTSRDVDSVDATHDEIFFEKSPEIMLLRAILARAVLDTLSVCLMVRPDDRRNARNWIMCDNVVSDSEDNRFTFIQICEFLNLPPSKIRDFVRAKEEELTTLELDSSKIAELLSSHKKRAVILGARE